MPEYDDFYNPLDDDFGDDDFDGEDFETKYLSSGINLVDSSDKSSSNLSKIEKNRQAIIDEVKSNVSDSFHKASTSISCDSQDNNNQFQTSTPLECSIVTKQAHQSNIDTPSISTSSVNIEHNLTNDNSSSHLDLTSSDLTKIAIQHLDKHQWQLPLMEMDKKFRDKTYYRHYTDSYISSLKSKLGHFIADTRLAKNPMKYHVQQEQDNYSKYSRMFALLTEYYQSIGGTFFSFATPSPDEEIVIGCRLGTKGCYRLETKT